MARRKQPQSLASVVAAGDHLASLKATADVLARTIEGPATEPQSVAGLAKQLVETLDRIAEHDEPEVSKSNELAERRRQRRAAVQARPASGE